MPFFNILVPNNAVQDVAHVFGYIDMWKNSWMLLLLCYAGVGVKHNVFEDGLVYRTYCTYMNNICVVYTYYHVEIHVLL